MEISNISEWHISSFITLENGAKCDEVRMLHVDRNDHKGVLVFVFSIYDYVFKKDRVLWCFVNRAENEIFNGKYPETST